MTEPLDLDAISREFLRECGSCDHGLPYPCGCPERDYRPTMMRLVEEVERLRDHLDKVHALAVTFQPGWGIREALLAAIGEDAS